MTIRVQFFGAGKNERKKESEEELRANFALALSAWKLYRRVKLEHVLLNRTAPHRSERLTMQRRRTVFL
jgi:hypothetical protein